MDKITVIGSGLVGALLSLYLARRGYQVDVFESRPDLRVNPADYGRSINLAMSCRGMTGLQALDLLDDVRQIMVPMRARAIHEAIGEINYQAFGRHQDEYINAIQRTDLNALLLDKAEAHPAIQLHFDVKMLELDLAQKRILFEYPTGERQTYHYQRLIGADGAASTVRETLKAAGLVQATREFLPHGYKELSISTTHGQHMAREHLHLWPRDSFLLLGNPNRDDSITGSLFLANAGSPASFAELNDEIKLTRFFKSEFADVYEAMPNLVDEFFNHPIGHLSTVKCAPWHYRDECLLIGDAAHGIVPFFGQGMNSGFEDCRILDALLDQYQDDWQQVMPAFFNSRKPNTDAVAALSMDNYREIQVDVRDKQFILRKQVELALMHRYPDCYVSKHVLVMFTNTPYAEAMAIGDIQLAMLKEICKDIHSLGEVNWQKVENMMLDYDRKLTVIRS